MILYNVTCNVDDSIHIEWIEWMKNEHLPQVLDTGRFLSYKMYKMLSTSPDETGHTYAIMYTAKDIDQYLDYRDNFAPALMQKTKQKFGEQVMAYRTLLEEVE